MSDSPSRIHAPNVLKRHRSGQSAASGVTNYDHRDGHLEGSLNIIAIRFGWTRKLNIPTHELSTLSYDRLEHLLELPSLKLRNTHLRIYVENPPNSGIWSKVRYFKDDGSLQSVLVQQFFQHRSETDGGAPLGSDQHGHVKLDIRDGADRDDAVSVRSGIIGVGTEGGSRINLPSMGMKGGLGRSTSLGRRPAWLSGGGIRRRRYGTDGTTLPGDTDDDLPTSASEAAIVGHGHGPPPPPPPKPSRTNAFLYLIGLAPPPAPPRPPRPTAEEIEAEAEIHAEAMRKRGWLPPGLRRRLSRKKNSSNPFLSEAERRDQDQDQDHDETDGLAADTTDVEGHGEEADGEATDADADADADEVGEGGMDRGRRSMEVAPMREQGGPQGEKVKSSWLRFGNNGIKSPKPKPKPSFKGPEIISKPHEAFPSGVTPPTTSAELTTPA